MTETQLRGCSAITPLLKQAQGGLKGVLAALRFSDDSHVKSFLKRYDATPDRDRRSTPWEAMALAAEVDLPGLLGAAILALQRHSSNTVKILALTNHPKITAARLVFAQMPGGVKDRDAIDTALGFLPTAKGNTFIGTVNNKIEVEDEDGDEDLAGDLDHLFPSLSKTQEALVPLRSRMIEAGK